ncbi:MAG: S-adenosyl-l-methionine hydroxide adenosyltransferase family protein [Verrucomicrobiales bacterium]
MKLIILSLLGATLLTHAGIGESPLVFQTDFGTSDGAVAAMKGVAYTSAPQVPLFDLTHQIPPYDVWTAALRLDQVVEFWPPDTVFVSVVDPGVGSDRLAVVAKLTTGQWVVTPDNGTLTFLSIEKAFQIEPDKYMRAGAERSHTFHGRDLFAKVGALLAAGQLDWEAMPQIESPVRIQHQAPRLEGQTLLGTLITVDLPFGNAWTNIPAALLDELGVNVGDKLNVTISYSGGDPVTMELPFQNTFVDVAEGQPLAYLNSRLQMAFAINMGSFMDRHKLKAGPDVQVRVRRAEKSTAE